MANILSLGTEDTLGIATLQDDMQKVQKQQSVQDAAISGNTAAIENATGRIGAVETTAENAFTTAESAQTAAANAEIAANNALPKSGGTMTGSISGGSGPDTKYYKHFYENPCTTMAMFGFGLTDKKAWFGFGDDAYELSSGVRINGIASPNQDYQAANKKYVDERYIVGTYRGDGQSSREVDIGFKPKFLIIMPYTYYTGGKYIIPLATGGGLADGADVTLISFSAKGFKFPYSSAYNKGNETYYYIAFK